MTDIMSIQRSLNHRVRAAFWLALFLVALNVTDWTLTYMALTYHGLSEVNHVVAAWISTPIGFIVKLTIPAIIGWRFLTRVSDRAVYHVLMGACVVYTLVVLWNTYAIYIR